MSANENIAKNLKALRSLRGRTLAELAAASGVSRAMISKVERGEGGPSAETLAKLAEALEVGISDLTAAPEAAGLHLLRTADQPEFVDASTGFRRRVLSPILPGRGIDVVRNELPPGSSTGLFPAHRRGVVEYLVVLDGHLRVEVGDEVLSLTTGDSLFFEAHAPHRLSNAGATPVAWILVIDATRFARA